MRVILDTNVLVSALIRRDSPPSHVLEAWFDDRFVLLSHPLLLEELRAVTRRPHIRGLIRPAEAGRLVNQLHALTEPVSHLPFTRRSEDAADDFLLAMSEAGAADHLATGDRAGLLALRHHGRTTILRVREFLDLLMR